MPQHQYHFDLGNSNDGPIGLCARIQADSPEAALCRLNELLASELELFNKPRGEYITIYINKANISIDDIDDTEEVDEIDNIDDNDDEED